MTKKEQLEVQAKLDELAWRASLHACDPVTPDIEPPVWENSSISSPEPLTKGYLPCYDHVEEACSSTVHHGLGQADKTTRQGARSLYSTRLLALQAMRHEMAKRFGKELARIDSLIQEEKAKPTRPSWAK